MNNTFNKQQFWSGATLINPDTFKNIKTCLVMVPHPDDESLGCAGLISTLIAKEVEVHLILTTDGSKSHTNSASYPANRLAALRLNELKCALKLLNVKEENCSFYEAPDAAMPAKGEPGFDTLVIRLKSDLIKISPDLIVVPYELDPHCDHRATHQLLISALEQAKIARPKIWEYPIWLYEHAEQEDIPKLQHGELLALEINDYLDLKSKCINAHQSQVSRLIDDDPTGFILKPEVIANFLQEHEYFMERKRINPDGTLSESYFEEMYSKNADPWNFETSAYEKKKYNATIAAIPNRDFKNGLEIGCSIGVLTEKITSLCRNLIAIDISQTALQQAKERLKDSPKVSFRLGGIPGAFPKGNFDLIIMSEVGYYLSMPDLLITREKILNALDVGGVLVLVHWTHFVADYPLSGDDVHEAFESQGLTHLHHSATADYRLDVFQKK